MAAPYSSLAGWISRPAPFNASKRGTRVKLSEMYSVAERVGRGYMGLVDNVVVYTAHPVPVGGVWRMTVIATTGWLSCVFGTLVSGLMLYVLYCQRVAHGSSYSASMCAV